MQFWNMCSNVFIKFDKKLSDVYQHNCSRNVFQRILIMSMSSPNKLACIFASIIVTASANLNRSHTHWKEDGGETSAQEKIIVNCLSSF